MNKILMVLAFVGLTSPVFAAKIDDITAAAKACGKDITKAQALKLIKKVYLTCKPNTKVDIGGGCEMDCKKENEGTIVGG